MMPITMSLRMPWKAVAVMGLSAIFALGPGSAAEFPGASTTRPVIVCRNPTFDFGRLDNTNTVIHTYVVSNAGPAMLSISNVRVSCACTVAAISLREVPPARCAEVTVGLRLAGQQGDQVKTAYVESNDPVTPHLQLTMKGVALQSESARRPSLPAPALTPVDLSVAPSWIMIWGATNGPPVQQVLRMRSGSASSFNVLGVDVPDPRIQVRTEVSGQGAYSITLSAIPVDPALDGKRVTIRTDASGCERMPIQIRVIVNPAPTPSGGPAGQ